VAESGKEVNIKPIIISGASDGSVKIWMGGDRTFDCTGHRHTVS
jgi:hypothetical protein